MRFSSASAASLRHIPVVLSLILVAACGSIAAPAPPASPTATQGSATQDSSTAPDTSSPPAAQATVVASRTLPIGATGPVDDGAWSIADRLAASTYTDDTTNAVVDGLARSGIGVYADTSSSAPDEAVSSSPSPLKLLDFQAHALAVGAWTSSDYTGAELDSVLPSPPSDELMPTTSQVLAGYVAAADTPGAALARALMAGQDLLSPATLRFPAIVLALFASDMATGGGGSTGRTIAPNPVYAASWVAPVKAASGVVPLALVSNTVCSDTENWIKGSIASLFDALRLATPDNLPGRIVVSIWNWLVSRVQSFVQGLISSVSNAVLGTIRSIAGTIAAVAEQISSLAPYGLRVTAIGQSNGATFMLGPNPLIGRYNASVSTGNIPDWPAVLADCAASADIPLPDLHPKNVPLTWGPLQAAADPLIAPDGSARTQDFTDANGEANWGFTTSSDPGDANEAQENQSDYMPVSIHRPEVEAARIHLTQALMGWVPGILQPFVGALFAPYISGLQARLNTLLDVRGTGTANLVFHDKPKPTPPPVSTPAPSTSCGVASGAYSGTTTNVSSEVIDQGTFGGIVDTTQATGTIALVVAADGSLTGTWGMRSIDVFDETAASNGVEFKDHRDMTLDYTGAVSGTACNLQLTFTTSNVVSCLDSLKGDCSAEQPPIGRSPAPTGFGPPTSASAGRATWTYNIATSTGAVVTDTFTIAVTAAAH